LQLCLQQLKTRFESLCVDLGNHSPFLKPGASTVTEDSAFIGGSLPIFEHVRVLCHIIATRLVTAEQSPLAYPPSDMDVYTGAQGESFVMIREKQCRANIANTSFEVNYVRGTNLVPCPYSRMPIGM
jgi:hypothetical protein